MNFNPYSRSHLGNPHPVYAALREERPVHLNDRPRFWAISRFEDVEAALRQWPVFSSASVVAGRGCNTVNDTFGFRLLIRSRRSSAARRAGAAR
jgi:cytochrome P450